MQKHLQHRLKLTSVCWPYQVMNRRKYFVLQSAIVLELWFALLKCCMKRKYRKITSCHLIFLHPLTLPTRNHITWPEGKELLSSSPWETLFASLHTEASAVNGFTPAGISYLQFSYLFIIGDSLLLHLWHKQAKKDSYSLFFCSWITL